MEIKYTKTEDGVEPLKGTSGAAGFDLSASEDVKIEDSVVLVGTGITMAIPENHVGLLFARSSLGVKRNLMLANSVGVIDSDYRGEIKVPLRRLQSIYGPVHLQKGERIAQIVIVPVPEAIMKEVSALEDTVRGEGGFGSTG